MGGCWAGGCGVKVWGGGRGGEGQRARTSRNAGVCERGVSGKAVLSLAPGVNIFLHGERQEDDRTMY